MKTKVKSKTKLNIKDNCGLMFTEDLKCAIAKEVHSVLRASKVEFAEFAVKKSYAKDGKFKKKEKFKKKGTRGFTDTNSELSSFEDLNKRRDDTTNESDGSDATVCSNKGNKRYVSISKNSRKHSKSKINKNNHDKLPSSNTESSINAAKIDEDEPKETKSTLDEKEEEERDFKRNNDVNENATVDMPSIVSTDTEQPNDESNIEELKKQINEIKLKLASRYGEISDDEDEDEETPHQRTISPTPNQDQNPNLKPEPVDEDEELKNDYGETVLHLAIKEGNFRKVKAICEEDPRLATIKGCDDNTVLHYAASNEQLLCLQILTQFGNIDEVNNNSETILHAAARTGSTKCVRWICDNYPELVNVKGPAGNTPLHYATIYDKFSCLLILLRYSDIFVKNDDGHTAHDIANQKVDEDNETDNE